jgi:hypothetical protein
MEITIHTRSLELREEMRESILRRLTLMLDTFESRLESVQVMLEDTNGPRGGIDKRCTLTASTRGAGRVMVRASAPTWFTALHRGGGRLKYRLSQVLRQAQRPATETIRKTHLAA